MRQVFFKELLNFIIGFVCHHLFTKQNEKNHYHARYFMIFIKLIFCILETPNKRPPAESMCCVFEQDTISAA